MKQRKRFYEHKLKQVIVKQVLLNSNQIFKTAGIEKVKKFKMCKIFWELGSIKKSPSKYFKGLKLDQEMHENWFFYVGLFGRGSLIYKPSTNCWQVLIDLSISSSGRLINQRLLEHILGGQVTPCIKMYCSLCSDKAYLLY